MKREGRGYRLTAIDRAVILILSFVCVVNGVYLIGPWYLEVRRDGDAAPLYSLFNSEAAVSVYGALLLVVSSILIFLSFRMKTTAASTRVLAAALLGGFLLRLYSTIGALLATESWRPPTYISQVATVFLFGAYWLWVKVNGKPTK